MPSPAHLPFSRLARLGLAGSFVFSAATARAADPTPGYPEPVVQWSVQNGETCEEVSTALYGSPKHAGLVNRYNRVRCGRGVKLASGTVLVMPETPTNLPNARLRSMHPDVRSKPPGGGWSPASSGAPLYNNHSVNTLEKGRADVEFVDRTRVFLAENTLVVIYGSANQTQVSKTPPPRVEVEAGEVKAGLAALRGDDEKVDVAVAGGGRVSAASRDMVIARKGATTTVAVFDGKADVASAGSQVAVPKDHGTRFVAQKPPEPPRPLPPAPAWVEGESSLGPLLSPPGEGLVVASWGEVPKAKLYRVEVSRDAGFGDLVVREEVASKVRSFRAEKMPPGTYFVQVRAIDGDDFLGIAAPARAVVVVGARLDGGPGQIGGELTVSPYATLRLEAPAGVELSLGGPFGPVPPAIDLGALRPESIGLRAQGQTRQVPVRYSPPRAEVRAERGRSGLSFTATLSGAEGVDLARLGLRARAALPTGAVEAPLVPSGSTLVASLPAPASKLSGVRLDVLDGRGAVLGSGRFDDEAPEAPPPAPAPAEAPPSVGAFSPHLGPSAATGLFWASPSSPRAASFGAVGSAGGGRSLQGVGWASGGAGALGVDAALRTESASGEAPVDSGAWLGARYRVTGASAKVAAAPGLRVGIPVSASAPALRLEPSVALGAALGRGGWLVNALARFRVATETDRRAETPRAQPAIMAGGYLDLSSAIRAHAMLDGQLLLGYRGEGPLGRGGLSVGLEAGGAVFASLSARASPWSDDTGRASGQLSIGVRER